MYRTRVTPIAFHISLVMCILAFSFIGSSSLPVPSATSSPGRNLIEINSSFESMKGDDDTIRVDPLEKLHKYREGYDITNKHYWSSAVFTGIYGYAIGAFWLLCGFLYGCFLLATMLCCKKSRKLREKTHSNNHTYTRTLLFAFLFALLAITASGVVLGGNARFHSQGKTVIDVIINTATEASETIYNTTSAMRNLRDSLVDLTGDAASSFLTSTSDELDVGATQILTEARKNRRLIDKILKIAYAITTVTLSLNLIAVIALSVFGILKLRRGIHVLVICCWILTALCWLFFGVYFFLGEFSGDTCTALEGFQQNPYNNSLSSILPCDDLLTAKPVLIEASAGVYDLVTTVNINLSLLQGTSLDSLSMICNPFSGPPEYKYDPDNCPENSVRIADVPTVLKNMELISEHDFHRLEGYTSSIQSLLNSFPGLDNLLECELVTDAFSDILSKHCKPLKRYARMTWIAMLFLSVVMVCLVSIWTVQTRRGRGFDSLDGSVKPHSAATNNVSESETGGVANIDKEISMV